MKTKVAKFILAAVLVVPGFVYANSPAGGIHKILSAPLTPAGDYYCIGFTADSSIPDSKPAEITIKNFFRLKGESNFRGDYTKDPIFDEKSSAWICYDAKIPVAELYTGVTKINGVDLANCEAHWVNPKSGIIQFKISKIDDTHYSCKRL